MAVNLSPIWGAGAQLFDNSGNVLSGGKIYTYAAGTTTPATTYTSSSGITANSNPIILNSAGRVPYEIWLSDTVAYKFVLKDSNDTLIATYDNLVGINSNFIAYTAQQEIQTATAGQTVFNLTTMQYQPGTNNLSVFVDGVNQYGPGAQYAYVETDTDTVTFVNGLHVGALVKFTTASPVSSGSTNAANVAYDPPFTGAVGTNVEAKLAQTVSVKDFGAVGDGVTDDTASIQNAVDSLTDGGSLYFPTGKYLVTSTINVLRSGIWLNGAGSGDGGAWIVNGSTNTPAIQFGDGITRLFDNGISKFAFGQQTGVTAVSGNCALKIDTCSSFNLYDLEIFPFPAAHYNGIVFSGVGQSQISTLKVQNSLNDGIYITDDCFDLYIIQSRADSNSNNGWVIENSNGFYFANCTAHDNNKYAWLIQTVSGAPYFTNNLFFVNCVGDTSGDSNWRIQSTQSFYMVNCWGSTQQSASVNTGANGFELYGSDVTDGCLSNCVGIFNNGNGLSVYGAKRINVVGGQWGKPTNGNGRGGFGSGIAIDNNSEDITLTSVQAVGNNNHGILFTSGNTRCNVLGGNLNGNSGAAIYQPEYATSIKNVSGFNPHSVTTPAFPASNVSVPNTTGVDCYVYFSGTATISQIQVNGVYVANESPCTVFLPAGSSIKVIYTVAPVWVWIGN